MGHLYDRLCEFENLCLAFHAARKGKRGQENVAAFERRLEPELFALQDELRNQTYNPGEYRSFYRTESKRRKISAAPFRDRVVHHALMQIIEPLFERRFIFDSYANRIGKGTHRALDRCTHFLRGSAYSLQCDARQFFPSIDHDILYAQLARIINDEAALGLIQQILKTGVGVLDSEYDMQWFAGDDLWACNRPRGLPIGNLTSQFWANVYLNPLDQFVKHELKCRRYLRYVDDFLLFADDKATLRAWQQAVIAFLSDLRLTIHEESAQIRPVSEGLPFLGFVMFPDHRRLKPRCGYAFRRRIRHQVREYEAGRLTQDDVTSSIKGWVAHAEHGDTYGLRSTVLAQVVL